MHYLGVDPGKSGAMCLLDSDGSFVSLVKLQETYHTVAEWLRGVTQEFDIDFAYLEKVHSMPMQGVASSFKFGESFGFCQGLLTSFKVKFDLVTPQKWQKRLSCLTKGDKNVTKALAQRLWPKVKVTHAIADALLIAEYARRERVLKQT